MSNTYIVILAAGKGTRMKSDMAKVLHPVLGKPLLFQVVNAALGIKPRGMTIVVGHQADEVKRVVSTAYPQLVDDDVIRFALQEPPMGTGHALWSAKDTLPNGSYPLLITNGDGPLVTSKTFENLLATQQNENAAVVVASFEPPEPFGYGRLVKENGKFKAIVEEQDATEEQKQIRQCCGGIYSGDKEKFMQCLEKVMQNKRAGEYYITDVVTEAVHANLKITTVHIEDYRECLGVNTIDQLKTVEEVLRKR